MVLILQKSGWDGWMGVELNEWSSTVEYNKARSIDFQRTPYTSSLFTVLFTVKNTCPLYK